MVKVSGLVGGEKYIFAVAAYTSNGELIGGSIGKSTKPILASQPLSLLSAWTYLAQVCLLSSVYLNTFTHTHNSPYKNAKDNNVNIERF